VNIFVSINDSTELDIASVSCLSNVLWLYGLYFL